MSAVAHFFVAVSGSFIHERMAQLFVDIYTYVYSNTSTRRLAMARDSAIAERYGAVHFNVLYRVTMPL